MATTLSSFPGTFSEMPPCFLNLCVQGAVTPPRFAGVLMSRIGAGRPRAWTACSPTCPAHEIFSRPSRRSGAVKSRSGLPLKRRPVKGGCAWWPNVPRCCCGGWMRYGFRLCRSLHRSPRLTGLGSHPQRHGGVSMRFQSRELGGRAQASASGADGWRVEAAAIAYGRYACFIPRWCVR